MTRSIETSECEIEETQSNLY